MAPLAQSRRFFRWDTVFVSLLVLCAAMGLKFHYSRAMVDDLLWILKPTAAVVETLSGTDFAYETGTGFVSRNRQFVIAPACAGINFMVIALCMAGFAGLSQRRTGLLRNLTWLAASVAGAWAVTIPANAVRITAAILVYQADVYEGWITPERIHRIVGIAVYLPVLYGCNVLIRRLDGRGRAHRPSAWTPVAWYAAVTVIVPFLNRAYADHPDRFLEHCWTVSAGCVIAFITADLLQSFWLRFGRSADGRRSVPGSAAGRKPAPVDPRTATHETDHSDR